MAPRPYADGSPQVERTGCKARVSPLTNLGVRARDHVGERPVASGATTESTVGPAVCDERACFASVFRKDYLMRQIEMAGRVLAAIIAKARSGQPMEALGMFDQAYQPLLGVGARLVPMMGDEQLLLMLKPGGVPDDNRWPAIVRLLVTEADLYMEVDQPAEALARYRKALMLLVELGGDKPAPDPEAAAVLAARLRGFHLGVAERADVAHVYEANGRFGDAEDTLFEGLDGDTADELTEAAIAFYRRLLDKDDSELEAGNLPRDEAEAGLAEVLARPPVP